MGILVIGSFDGVHRGHACLIARARALGEPVVAITFRRHPRELLGKGVRFLTCLEQKVALLKAVGVSRVIVVDMDEDMLQWSGATFIRRVLKPIRPDGIVVGEGFRFGRGRQSGAEDLARCIRTIIVPLYRYGGEVCSSSVIRRLIEGGKLEESVDLLGHTWEIRAPRVPGAGVGGSAHIPTVNLNPKTYVLPPFGVYMAKAKIFPEEAEIPAVVNLGCAPTYVGRPCRLEVHFLQRGDFDIPVGRSVDVSLLQFMRPEKKFGNEEELRGQIERDITAAKDYFY